MAGLANTPLFGELRFNFLMVVSDCRPLRFEGKAETQLFSQEALLEVHRNGARGRPGDRRFIPRFSFSYPSLRVDSLRLFLCKFDVGLLDTRQPIAWLLREKGGQSGVVATRE